MEQLSQANAKIKMICRMVAEIGFKPLAKKVHALLIKHQDKSKVVQLRNKFVTVDPSEWKDRFDMTVTVGLGNGTKTEVKEALGLIGQGQMILKEMGLVGPEEAYNLFSDIVKVAGKNNPESYAINPDPQNPKFQQVMQARQKPPPNPLVEVEQVKQQSLQQIAKMKEDHKHEMDTMKMQSEMEIERNRLRMDAMKDQMKQSTEFMIVKFKEEQENYRKIMENEVKALIEGFKVDIGKPGIGAEMQ